MPLGVQLYNENKLNEMTQILLGLNKYVPVYDTETSIEIDGKMYTQSATELSPRLLFGDQLTSARVRGAAALRSFHKTSLDCLEGHIPVTSDWHARLCLVTVSLYTQIVICIYYICVFRFYRVDSTVHHLKIRELYFN